MNVSEAAERLEVSPKTIYALCAAGRLPHTRIGVGRGVIRIAPEDLEAFRQAARVEGPAYRPDRSPAKGHAGFGGYKFQVLKPKG